jgi:preprotein translocase subunit SecG
MEVFIFVLIILVCVFLALIVLIQNPKGGGLDSNFSSANQIGGVKKTADFLEKGTWTLAIVLFVLCLASAGILGTSTGTVESGLEYQETELPSPEAAPVDGGEDMGGDEGAMELPVE